MSELPENLQKFIKDSKWIFAKTYADTWPHEYIVREHVDENLFLSLVLHIRNYGHIEKFYDTTNTYYGESGKVYWTMDETVEETTIINRCKSNQTYEYRLDHHDLPKQRTDS